MKGKKRTPPSVPATGATGSADSDADSSDDERENLAALTIVKEPSPKTRQTSHLAELSSGPTPVSATIDAVVALTGAPRANVATLVTVMFDKG